jgi:hypothetical protein
MAGETLPRAEVSLRLRESEWRCVLVREYKTHALWRTSLGFYFTVGHDCTEDDFHAIWIDLVRYGKGRNL